MQNITSSLTEQEINGLVQDFLDHFTVVIKKAAGQADLDVSYHDDLVSQIALKYSRGQLSFDPSRNTKDTTYIYQIARNAAIDIRRKNSRWITASPIDENDPNGPELDTPYDSTVSTFEIEDTEKILCQTFDLLEKQYHFSQRNLKLFLEWNFSHVSVRELAEKYGLKPNRLSNQLSKIKKAYWEVYNELLRKENDGTLELSVNLADYRWVVDAVA